MDWVPVLVGRLTRSMRRLLRRRGRTNQDAEDLIQEAFLRLHLYYEQGGEVDKPEGFLVRTVLRLSIDAHRKARRHLAVEEAVEDLPLADISADPRDIVAAEQDLEQFERTLESLGEDNRDIFLLHRIDQLTYAQIGELYGMTEKAVEHRVARAMLALSRESKLP